MAIINPEMPKDKYIISYICRISEQKRPFLLLQVIRKMLDERKDFLFLIVGDGNLLASMKANARKMGLTENIRFWGRTSKTDEIYALSDMTINCSIKEGLALTAYESLAMGVPVVSSDVGGQKELINEKTGVIVPCIQNEEDIFKFDYSDEEIDSYVIAINKVLNNLNEYKKECRQRILNGFTIDQMVEKMTNIIDNTIKKSNESKIMNINNLDVGKELMTYKLMLNKAKYEWECEDYNKYYGFNTHNGKNYKFELFKEKMWQHKWYRGFIRLLQKAGIIGAIKKRI